MSLPILSAFAMNLLFTLFVIEFVVYFKEES